MHRLAYAYQFLLVASIGGVFVFLSDIRDAYGLPEWGIGLVASVGFLTTLPATFIVSPLADRGYTGPLIIGATGLAVAGNLLFGFGDTLWHFVVSRGLLGAAIAMGGLAVKKAVIGHEVDGAGQKLGALLSASVAGFILGPPLAAQLERFGFATVFIVFAVAIVAVTIPLLGWAWNSPVATSRMTFSSVTRLLERPGLRGALLGYTALFGAIGIFDSVVDIYLDDLGASNTEVGLILLIIGAPLVVLPSPAGSFVERSNARRIFPLAMVAAAFSVSGYGLFPSLIGFTLAGILHSSVEAVSFTSCQVLTVRETGASQSAAGQALLESAGAIVAGATAFMGPVIFDLYGPRVLFIGYGSIILVGAFFSGRLLNRSDRSIEMAPAEPVVV
ncbi:MAG: MFS transporter [Acidimicrobiales bacterium]|nr:MFS transporter [Acidimicrobiales bacterium]